MAFITHPFSAVHSFKTVKCSDLPGYSNSTVCLEGVQQNCSIKSEIIDKYLKIHTTNISI